MSADNQIKRIIIVGATSGLGRKMAELYAAAGNIVGITGRRKELLDEIENMYPGKIKTGCFDVTGNENIQRLTSLIQEIGGLDILIYSSGIGELSKGLDWEIDKLTVETNVIGFIEIANWSFNYFLNQGDGRMAVISSIAANRGNSWAPAYSASKAFQSNYFEALAIKAKKMKKAIGIICVEPGFVDTKMAKGNKRFWVVPLDKAARQIITGIEKKKQKVYVSKRWWLVAGLMRLTPFWLYKKIG
ncbi:MAG TPA: SDR family NAD(P)-dependent oxidoreductase [Chitinophagaceae bacterium]|jgi:short-subunit dehydrogenase